MKFKKIMITSSLLMIASCRASSSVSLMNAATANLQAAQTVLTAALGLPNISFTNGSTSGLGGTGASGGATGSNNPGGPVGSVGSGSVVNLQKSFAYIFNTTKAKLSQAVPIVVNTATTPVYVIMLDQSGNQINPSPIQLTAQAFSYLPANIAKIKLVDGFNNQLLAPFSINSTTCYNVVNTKKKWQIAAQSAPVAPANITYTNSTDIPVIITITTDTQTYNQQIDPSQVCNQEIDPTAKVTLNIHPNLSAIYSSYQTNASYQISMVDNELQVAQISNGGSAVVNNCKWPVVVSLASSDNKFEYTLLGQGHRYQITDKNIISLTVIPSILNYNSSQSLVKSLKIVNQNGKIVTQ